MSSAAEKANLARIRDNQRRSRARRKEYLQELEARLHQCELQGIEASAEIQLAARRVVDENRKLRILLARQGITEPQVEAFLQSSMTGQDVISGIGFSLQGHGQATGALEHLLNTKRQISADTGAPRNGTVNSRESSVTSMSSSRWATPQRGAFLTPSSSVGHSSQRSSTMVSNHSQAQHTAGSLYDLTTFDNQYTNQRQHQIYQPQSQDRKITALAQAAQRHGHSSRTQSQSGQFLVLSSADPSAAPNPVGVSPASAAMGTESCVFAADMISTMSGSDARDVRADLGCNDFFQEECEVDNRVVFGVLDQYNGDPGDAVGGLHGNMGSGM